MVALTHPLNQPLARHAQRSGTLPIASAHRAPLLRHRPARRGASPSKWAAAAAGEGPPSTLGLTEAAALDEFIDTLMAAQNSEELARAVAENLLSCDQRFWLRLATRSDTASSPEEAAALSALARVVMQLVDAMVRKTNERLSDSASVLQAILRAAADERTGEWEVPLPEDKVAALRAALDANAGALDEALLSNCFAWMRKAAEDKLDGMVTLLQKVLQLYAARALAAAPPPPGAAPADVALHALLGADEAEWAGKLRRRVASGEVSEVSLLEALQRRMESVVLGLASGSYAQRVQAEYLKELESRAKAVFGDIAAGR